MDKFPTDYKLARKKFLAAAETSIVNSYEIPVATEAASNLYIDIARIGSSRASKALVIVSGTHGVEGFAGSAIQCAILESDLDIPDNCAIYFVHALNPFGMANLRRTNENNVDLNRNFILDDCDWSTKNSGYRNLVDFLNPRTPPSIVGFYIRALWEITRHGMQSVKQAVAGGQYEFPEGIYYGGSELQPSIKFFSEFVLQELADTKQLFGLEVHSGLGAFAESSLLVSLNSSDQRVALLRQLFPEYLIETDDQIDVAFETKGSIATAIPKLLPNTEVLWVTQEVGTYSVFRVLNAMRAENQLHFYGSSDLSHPAKQELLEVFTPNSVSWHKQVVEDGVKLIRHAANHYF